MVDLGFWIPSLGLPLAALFANVIIRKIHNLPQSGLPDIILCFVVFDALVAIQHDEFRDFIRMQFVKDAVSAVYVIFIIVNLVAWFIAVTEFERKLLLCHARHGTSLTLNGIYVGSYVCRSDLR